MGAPRVEGGGRARERVFGGRTWQHLHSCLLILSLRFGWGRSVVPDPHSPPFPETITSLYKTSFRVDVPFDLPEIFFFVALG